jgi:hypothetical protein
MHARHGDGWGGVIVGPSNGSSLRVAAGWFGSSLLCLQAVEFLLGELLEILRHAEQHASRYRIVCLRCHEPHPLGSFEPMLGSIDKGNQGHGVHPSMLDGAPSQLE